MGTKEDEKTQGEPARSGGVEHDARGNAVWKWAVDTGRHAIDSTSRLLRRLEAPELTLEEESQRPAGE